MNIQYLYWENVVEELWGWLELWKERVRKFIFTDIFDFIWVCFKLYEVINY